MKKTLPVGPLPVQSTESQRQRRQAPSARLFVPQGNAAHAGWQPRRGARQIERPGHVLRAYEGKSGQTHAKRKQQQYCLAQGLCLFRPRCCRCVQPQSQRCKPGLCCPQFFGIGSGPGLFLRAARHVAPFGQGQQGPPVHTLPVFLPTGQTAVIHALRQ